jgi:predicted TIM-barrel fold metal-dependent hydrolase
MLQKRLGLTRNVIIQPSAYGTNNDCTLSALKVMGDNARAIVVINQTISDDELAEMNALGVRGIRFNIATGASNEPQNILRMAHKVHQFGWHVQFWMSAQDTVDLAPILQLLPNQIVFDHRGHLPQPEGINHPAYKIISSLLERGKAWVKLSGLYIDTNASAPGYSDTVEVGKAFVDIAPERAVWGTDWPHPSIFSERRPWPDDAEMLSLLALQAPDQKVLHQILVENPEVLYGFSSTKNLKG